jgi:hypothetical protein
VPAFTETRDTHLFSRRVGDLPLQQEGEQYDYRPLLHRCRGREGGGGRAGAVSCRQGQVALRGRRGWCSCCAGWGGGGL